MKYRLLFALTTLFTVPTLSQAIEKIVFTSQRADEPPTINGQPTYVIEFTDVTDRELATSNYFENKTRKNLREKITIEKERTEKVAMWTMRDKRIFSPSELEFDITSLRTAKINHTLNFEIPMNLVIKVDSFQFCQAYKMTRSIATGGEKFSVQVIYINGQHQLLEFHSNDIGERKLNLLNYILCYTLFEDRIPSDVVGYSYFTKEKFLEIILEYQKTVECEGYYYKEFTDKNPAMSSKDKRMMKGWNFVEYMEQRNKIK